MSNNSLRLRGLACSLLVACVAALFTGCNNEPAAPATVAGFTCLEDLEGHSVAVITSSTSDVLLSDTNNFSNINLVRCDSPTELFASIKEGKASIDQTLCVGCEVCSQLCKFGALQAKKED